MPDPLQDRILGLLKTDGYSPQHPRELARALDLVEGHQYDTFRSALRQLMDEGRIVTGSSGAVVLPGSHGQDEIVGSYRHNRRGFGFVVPSDPTAKEDLFIPPNHNMDAITGDIVRAKIVNRGFKEGKAIADGRIVEVIERKHTKFAGTLAKIQNDWIVQPDGNTFTDPILVPDAAGKHLLPGTKVVVELTQFPADGKAVQGVIAEVLGQEGEKDVDLKSVIIQHNLPGPFPEAVKQAASEANATFDPHDEKARRLDLTDAIICTIDPTDAKDFDDAISLAKTPDGYWELGVHIADVSHFVKKGSPLDEEAAERGNSCYFPGHVIPMLPEILSNGVCSLQEGVPRLVKSAFIVLDDQAKPYRTRFANSVIHSSQRFRYEEAQAIIDGADEIPHPDGPKKLSDYRPEIVDLLGDMNRLAKRMKRRRYDAGQLNLNLPEVELVLDDAGKVVGTAKEDDSFTHTLIEMFMVEANEAVARLLDKLDVPFLRRTHPTPEAKDAERLGHFMSVSGHPLPDPTDRKAIQQLLERVKGKPEEHAINLAVLKSLTRAEYSPKKIGHFALASDNYGHFTSPIRRYADLTVHRLLDAYFDAANADFPRDGAIGPTGGKRPVLKDIPTYNDLVELGRHISFTERRAEDAERELRQVKLLTLMEQHVGEEFNGVVTGMTNFGLFVQLETYLIDGLIRYENLLDDWWEVDAKGGVIRGERTGQRIQIGDVVKTRIARVDLARRELDLTVLEVLSRGTSGAPIKKPSGSSDGGKSGEKRKGRRPEHKKGVQQKHATGADRRGQRSRQRDKAKGGGRGK